MAGKTPASTTGVSSKRRVKRLVFYIFLAVFTIYTTSQILFKGTSGQIPLADNILVLFLLNINILLLLLMAILAGRNLVKLYFERQSKAFGAGFQTKLILSFLAFTLIPSTLLFIVASGLLTNSIDNWVSAPVEKSLRDSLEIADMFYQRAEKNVGEKAFKLAKLLGERETALRRDDAELTEIVLSKYYEYEVGAMAVFGSRFNVVEQVSKNNSIKNILANIGSEFKKRLLTGEIITETSKFENDTLVVSMAPIIDDMGNLKGAVVLANPIDRILVEKITSITKTFDSYKQLKLQKFPIKAVYEVTLLLITLVILFAAIWYGFYLARDITVPIYSLLEATEKVAEGDLSVRVAEKSSDEIGYLMRSFNRMTGELESSREKLQSGHKELQETNLELDRRRKYIETILAKITTGVISIDHRGRITTCNQAAISILKLKDAEPFGKYYEEAFEAEHLDYIRKTLREMGKSEKDSIEKELQFTIDGQRRTLLIHTSSLKDPRGHFMGVAVVFDDLTDIISAQKTSAWREVAQHIAHEIKNPLTPIRLNAERLVKKFKQDPESFEKIFEKSTNVIIHEVDVLKGLVDEFSRFAQLPEAHPKMVSLHNIINDVVQLYKDLHPAITFKTSFDPSIGDAMLDSEQMYRAFRNLIENAIDAVDTRGAIEIRTFRETEQKRIHIDIIDDGPGINAKDFDKVFLPYFSTKKKGAGLGLAIVNRIVADHEGRISVKNNEPHGTVMAIELPTA
ncbi:MAG: ATP-binding protein [Nitrospinota bacterium]